MQKILPDTLITFWSKWWCWNKLLSYCNDKWYITSCLNWFSDIQCRNLKHFSLASLSYQISKLIKNCLINYFTFFDFGCFWFLWPFCANQQKSKSNDVQDTKEAKRFAKRKQKEKLTKIYYKKKNYFPRFFSRCQITQKISTDSKTLFFCGTNKSHSLFLRLFHSKWNY